MPSIYVFRRKWKDKEGKQQIAKEFSAEIRFSGGARYLRRTGETEERRAKAAARGLAADIEAKELPRRGKEVMTLGKMFAKWGMEKGNELRSGKDVAWQIEKLMQFIGEAREVAEIGNKDVNGFVQDAKLAGHGPVVINRCLERLRATMNFAAKRWEEPVRVIDWREFRQKEPKAREVYLSPPEARRLMEALPKHIALAFAFTLYTGCRLNEMQTLRWDWIDFGRGVANVVTKAQGAEIVTRLLWLSEKAMRVLHGVGVPPEIEIGACVPIERVRVFTLTNRRRHWEAARKKIGREDLHWHDIRAMTASWARQYTRADNTLIAETLGHSDVEVTRRYTRVVDREIVEMLNQLPDIDVAESATAAPIESTINLIDQKARNT
jgi:integrase